MICPYGNSHDDLVLWASEYVDLNRRRIGLEEYWSIFVRVVCPLPGKRLSYEGKITWESEVWYAQIDLVCTLPGSLYEWVLVHELFELKHWRTGDAFQSLVGQMALSKMRALFAQRFREARNQEIELEVGQYLATRRPGHLMAGEPPPVMDEWQRRQLVQLLRAWRTQQDNEEEEEEESPYPDIVTITKHENDET